MLRYKDYTLKTHLTVTLSSLSDESSAVYFLVFQHFGVTQLLEAVSRLMKVFHGKWEKKVTDPSVQVAHLNEGCRSHRLTNVKHRPKSLLSPPPPLFVSPWHWLTRIHLYETWHSWVALYVVLTSADVLCFLAYVSLSSWLTDCCVGLENVGLTRTKSGVKT